MDHTFFSAEELLESKYQWECCGKLGVVVWEKDASSKDFLDRFKWLGFQWMVYADADDGNGTESGRGAVLQSSRRIVNGYNIEQEIELSNCRPFKGAGCMWEGKWCGGSPNGRELCSALDLLVLGMGKKPTTTSEVCWRSNALCLEPGLVEARRWRQWSKKSFVHQELMLIRSYSGHTG